MALGDLFFYHPTSALYDSPADHGLRVEEVLFDADDGVTLHGWFFPACGPARGTVLHLHGNAGNVTGHFGYVGWLSEQGWNVLCFDYRGYGQSQGRVTRSGTILDAHAALDYLLTRGDVDLSAIVVFGQSLGGAVGIVMAADRQEVCGVAVDGAFDSYRGIARWHVRRNLLLRVTAWWAPGWLIRDELDPIDVVSRIAPRPLLIMHGTADRIVDPAMAQRLYDAAGEPKELWLVDGADHYEAIDRRPDQTRPRLLAFHDRCVRS
jgi:fermentation-respiration switch protein FrsA (DUF1100 family)